MQDLCKVVIPRAPFVEAEMKSLRHVRTNSRPLLPPSTVDSICVMKGVTLRAYFLLTRDGGVKAAMDRSNKKIPFTTPKTLPARQSRLKSRRISVTCCPGWGGVRVQIRPSTDQYSLVSI
ncbi:hypothetical protein J6590_023979 [Homalodisca vitripennis]|nr:hypothetical protein J6590_023979 [Homalodisca vitripennis]